MKYLLILLVIVSVGTVIFRLGKHAQLVEIREKYPHLYNFKEKDGCCIPAEHDDIWITDSARVHIYVSGAGWKKLN